MSLFRPEALKASERRIEGEVNLAVPVGGGVLTMILSAFVAVAIVGASVFPYSRRELATGVITPEAGLTRLFSGANGRVERLLVTEGQTVRRGDAVMEIVASDAVYTDTSHTAEMALLAGEALDRQLEATRRRSQAERQTLEADQARLTGLLTAQHARLVGANRRVEGRRQSLALALRDLERIEVLATSGFAPERERALRATTVIQAQADLDEAESAVLTLGGEIAQTRSLTEAGRQSELRRQAESDGSDAQYQQARAEVRAKNRWVVTSPIDGRVATLSASPGDPVNADRLLAVVVPAGGRLEAELQVPVSAMGMLRVGQPVRFQYDAYPHQRYGAGDGLVISIAGTPAPPVGQSMQGGAGESVYRVRASLRSTHISAFGLKADVQPGMTLRASIVTGRRTLLQWLTDPIRDAGRRA